MDQQKTGAFLKRLRREKGLTQEQLAEHFYVSSRTVSRWETGSNMPDVGMLIELADFYEVDIREIIDGERKGEIMDKEMKDTLKKVAAYATEGESKKQSRVMHIALGISIALFICTILFMGGFKGALYGIVPEAVCNGILAIAYMLAGALLVSYLRMWWAQETPTQEPHRAVKATVISKEVVPGTHGAGRSKLGYSYAVTFRTTDGQTLELFAYEEEFGALREGMSGMLSYRGRYFVDFN